MSASDDVMKVAREIALAGIVAMRRVVLEMDIGLSQSQAVAIDEVATREISDSVRKAALAAILADRASQKAELRGNWHGVVLDGRNEHGSHVLMLPQRSIELEQDSNGDFLKDNAEAILREAEAKGFKIGDAVVVTFDLCLDDGFFSHYEFVGVSFALTALFYGSPEEQDAGRERAARDWLQKNGGGNG